MRIHLIILCCFVVYLNAYADIHIASNQTVNWTSSTIPSFSGNLILDQNSTLTIDQNSQLLMDPASFIIIKEEAKLIMDGVTINCSAPDALWKGIVSERYGCLLMNSCTIIHSECAYSNYYNFSRGGSIRAIDVDFIDNKKFLEIKDYNYQFNTSSFPFNVCLFRNCSFQQLVINNNLYTPSFNFIELDHVWGPKFWGCDFYNLYPAFSSTCGIRADDSRFKIEAYGTDRNSFTGFFYGIFAVDGLKITYPTTPMVISGCDFFENKLNDNFSCIELNYINNAMIYSNYFQMTPYWDTDCSSICLRYCSGFLVEDNFIDYDDNSSVVDKAMGIVILNSGSSTNRIYRNYFHNAGIGIRARGTNRGQATNSLNQGLKFLCNEFESFDDAFYIMVDQCNSNLSTYGVAGWQGGAIQNNPLSPNFNIMPDRNLSSTSENDFKNEHQAVAQFDIQYGVPTNPGSYDINYISTTIERFQTTVSSATTHCESRLPVPSNPFDPNKPILMPANNIYTFYPRLDTIEIILEELVNDGNSTYLLALVQDVSEDNIDEVYETLLQSNPSLDIILLVCSNELFSSDMLTNLLSECSYGIKSQAVRNALDSRNDSLDNNMMSQIYQAAQTFTEYEELLAEKDQLLTVYNLAMDESIRTIGNRDSVPVDSLKMFLRA